MKGRKERERNGGRKEGEVLFESIRDAKVNKILKISLRDSHPLIFNQALS